MDDQRNLFDWKEKHENQIVSRCLKYSLMCFAFVFWCFGALFAAVGGWHISQVMDYREITEFSTNTYGIFAALGCLVFIISSFGFMGALRENICLLRIYKISLVVALVVQFLSGMIAFAFWPEVKKIIDHKMRIGIRDYWENPSYRRMIDEIQRMIGCCGSLTVDDWDSNKYFRCKFVASYRTCGVPWSCCLRKHERNYQCGFKIRKSRPKMANDIYTIGCLDKVFDLMRSNMHMIAGLAVGSVFVLVGGLLMTHRMIKQIRKLSEMFNDASETFGWERSATIGNRSELSTTDELSTFY